MSELSARTRLMAVIGDPIGHSLSPRIHNAFARRFGLDVAYMAFRVTPETLSSFVAAARTLDMHGFNVTMPLKLQIAPYLDALDGTALGGTVNTVYVREGRLIGGCTDGDGFLKSLALQTPSAPYTQALILGAGGAARVIALSLARAGVPVTVASRRAVRFDTDGLAVSFCRWEDINPVLPKCDLLVNATPLGMAGAAEFGDFNFLRELPDSALVYDLVYNPRVTKLLQHAEQRGLHTANGLSHLVCQAVLSFEMFTGCRPSDEDIARIIRELNAC